MITLGTVSWGGSPAIPITFEYEKRRSGADMQYRIKITVDPVTGDRYFGYPIYFSWAIDGVYITAVTLKNANPSRWENAITYTTPWHTVANKTTGTTGVSFNVYSGLGSSRSYHYGYTMAVDPAASEIRASNGTLGTPLTINVTRYNTAFTDTITFECGSARGTVRTGSTATSVTWDATNGNTVALAAQNTTGVSVNVTFTVSTYSGSTLVGSNSITVACAIPGSVKPSVALTIEDTAGYYNTYGAFVQGCSRLKITAKPTLAYGSPIKAYSITADGKTYGTSPAYTEVVQGFGTLPVTAKVTDHRDRPSDPVAQPIAVLEYARPTVTVSAYRCNSSGTADDEGAYMRIGFTADISSLSGKNRANYVITYSSGYSSGEITGDGTSFTTDAIACDVTAVYSVEVVVNDNISSTTKAATIPIAFTLMDYYHTGEGVSFGKVATRNGFDCAMNGVYFNNKRVQEVGQPVAAGDAVPLGFLRDYIVEQASSGSWTYRKWNSGMAELWGHAIATHANGSVAYGPLTYPFGLVSRSCGVVTLNSAGGNGIGALPWNAKLVYDSQMCEVWVHSTSGTFDENTAIDASVYIIGRWK